MNKPDENKKKKWISVSFPVCVHWSTKPTLVQQKGKTQRDLSLLQIRLRCFQVGREHGILVTGQIQPSPEKEDGLG